MKISQYYYEYYKTLNISFLKNLIFSACLSQISLFSNVAKLLLLAGKTD